MESTMTREVTEQQQYLTFQMSEEEYAVGICQVREIIEYSTVTRVPKAPAWIRGVINVRGSVVPVVDLAVKFGVAAQPVTKTTCIIILEIELDGEDSIMGVIADAVNEVTSFTAEDIEKAPSFGTRVRVEYLLGMAKIGKKFALMLDMQKVLSGEELVRLGEVPAQAVRTEANGTERSRADAPANAAASAIVNPRAGKSKT
ncbi:MAG TPA: chemotaxis protein CheW [Verrucomicrobiae bacterium]|jgi:purine-binding chemotaxis protein CheW|nr:chemotaxis protein CheW [Verrucomicrobiae bacterium]